MTQVHERQIVRLEDRTERLGDDLTYYKGAFWVAVAIAGIAGAGVVVIVGRFWRRLLLAAMEEAAAQSLPRNKRKATHSTIQEMLDNSPKT